jgi:receptor protein-tyrosine kinase
MDDINLPGGGYSDAIIYDTPAPRTIADMARAGLIIETEGRTRLGDEFRIAAARLHTVVKGSVAANERCGNMVLITSTRPAEGKSFCAVNMAASLARTGSRSVLLVDADAKVRCLSELLGLQGCPGLLDLAADSDIAPERLVVATPVPGLFVLPLGDTLAGLEPGERSQPLPAAAEQLSRRFASSTVVIDTGPLLATSDPSVLAPVASQSMMVIESGRTQRSELEAALEMIKACPKVVMLLNKQASRARSSFGAYSYTGDYYAKPNAPPPPRPE